MAHRRTLPPQPWMTAAETVAVMDALEAGGAEARFVGGCVRDALLGAPVHDIDIATHAEPDQVMALLAKAGIKTIPTGIAHGTVTAVAGDAHFEITTLRRDVRTRGRHADVAFTDDWKEDAARRDFTINALSLDRAGRVFDPFGGLDDLDRGRVRFVGDAETRIREDVLRLLRFFRFHARFGRGAPDPDAIAAARKLAHLLPTLSAERIWSELRRILAGTEPAAAVALMAECGVLAPILPEATGRPRLAALAAIEAAQGIGGDAVDPLRRLAALVAVDEDGAAALADRLRLSRAEGARLRVMARDGGRIAPDWRPADARRAIYTLGTAAFRDCLFLSWAGERAEGAGRDVDAAYTALLEIAASFTAPRLPIKGEDAVALGVPAGPRVGAAMAEVEAWWVAADFVPDRAACLARLGQVVAGH